MWTQLELYNQPFSPELELDWSSRAMELPELNAN